MKCPEFENKTSEMPSLDDWLKQARLETDSHKCGMYLFHTGFVRSTPKSVVRGGGSPDFTSVTGMDFSFDTVAVEAAVARAKTLPGIFFVRVWINKGRLATGDPLMLVLVGGDIRPHVISALESLVEELKSNCVKEIER